VSDDLINTLTDIDITQEMVASHIKRLKSNKSAGGDGLSFSFLKEMEVVIVKPFVIIFRKLFEDGVVPLDWRVANVSTNF